MAAKIGIKADRIISPNSQPILIAALRTRGCGDCAVAGLGLLRRLSFLVLAAAQEILRQRDKSFDIALQFAAIFQRLLQLVEKIGGAEIKATPRPVAEADQLLVCDVWQSDNAVVEAVFGQPRAPVLDLNVIPLFGFFIGGRTFRSRTEMGRAHV